MAKKNDNKKKFKSKFRNDAFTKQTQTALTDVESQIRKMAETFIKFNYKPLQQMTALIIDLTQPIKNLRKQQQEFNEIFQRISDKITFHIPEGVNINIPKFQKETMYEYIIHRQHSGIYISHETKEEIADITTKKIIQELSLKPEQKKQNNANKYSFPNEFKWEDITIKFLDGHNIRVLIKGRKFTINYKEIGVEDSKTLKPKKQWLFLEYLAKHNGEVSWKDIGANETLKSRKKELSKTLKSFFELDEDPFYTYKKFKMYKIKTNFQE